MGEMRFGVAALSEFTEHPAEPKRGKGCCRPSTTGHQFAYGDRGLVGGDESGGCASGRSAGGRVVLAEVVSAIWRTWSGEPGRPAHMSHFPICPVVQAGRSGQVGRMVRIGEGRARP